MRYAGFPARVPKRGAPLTYGDAVLTEDTRVRRRVQSTAPLEDLLQRRRDRKTRPVLVLERRGESWMTPPFMSTSSHVSSRISLREHWQLRGVNYFRRSH